MRGKSRRIASAEIGQFEVLQSNKCGRAPAGLGGERRASKARTTSQRARRCRVGGSSVAISAVNPRCSGAAGSGGRAPYGSKGAGCRAHLPAPKSHGQGAVRRAARSPLRQKKAAQGLGIVVRRAQRRAGGSAERAGEVLQCRSNRNRRSRWQSRGHATLGSGIANTGAVRHATGQGLQCSACARPGSSGAALPSSRCLLKTGVQRHQYEGEAGG